ncbi:ataxin-2-like protein [Hyperolius riggenbachi]|uniref:ataxin-2-like protein n=1 Tax=Hyperolius riggenbachi TaxID=752182 RepID=UPI0035A37F65
MIKQQPASATRKPVSAAMAVSSPGSPNGNPLPPARSQERPAAGRGRSSIKSNQASQGPVFDGLYNNSRMLHYLTAAVGSTCDVKVKNGNTFQGVFKTVSSKFEMAVDAVHKKTNDQAAGPKREDIVDTMVFKNSDVVFVKFQNVDFSYATKDKFTDSAIATNAKVNGEHKDKVLLRWEGSVGGGDSNSDDFELESDLSNGWDPNDMFKFNEDNYGVKTTYDSSLSSYTVPLEKDNSEEYRQREARAAQLAREIESSPQYRARIAVENDDGRTEEEKHSSVQRPSSDRDSPSFSSRDGKYVPMAQRTRDGLRGGLRTNPSRGGRPGMGSLSSRSAPQHYPDAGSSPVSEQRVINGGLSRMSPKSQRPMRGTKTMTSPSSRPQEISTSPSAPSRVYVPLSPKSGSSVSSLDTSSQASTPDSRPTTETNLATKPTSPKAVTPTIAVEVKDVPVLVVKEQSRTLEQNAPCDAVKQPCKVLQADQKRTQLDELRKFGAEFRLQPSSAGPESALETFPQRQKETLEAKMPPQEASPGDVTEPHGVPHKVAETVEEPKEDRVSEIIERQEEAASPACKPDVEEKEEPIVCEQVKKSTLNPNAKEFNPKALLSVNKATSTPTSPGPRNPTTTTLPIVNPGQYGSYMYIPQIHMSQAVQSQIYPYAVSNSVPGQQGKYRPKGPTPRNDQPSAAPPIMQAAAAAGPPLVAATPYSPYISYSPQQFPGQAAMMQPMAHYQSQPVFAQMLQSNQRMLTSGNHPQALVSSNHQYQTAEQPTPQQLYATVQSYSHHAAQLHPQPASTPTQSQQQAPHANPSPVQHQGGQPPHLGSGQPQQNIYHTATLTATPPSMTPGPTAQSPQSNYPQQAVYAIHAHQQLQHGYTNMSHVAQAHVQTGMTGAPPPHPGAPHPPHPGAPHPTQVMLLHPAQTHGGPPQGGLPQTGVSTPSPFSYMPHPQVQSHPSQQLPFHPPGN